MVTLGKSQRHAQRPKHVSINKNVLEIELALNVETYEYDFEIF